MKWSQLDHDNQLNKLSWLLCTKLNIAKGIHKDKEFSNSSVAKFIETEREPNIIMLIPQGNDGSINHAITVGNGMIFDSTQDFPLTITKESFDFICGDCGYCKIYKTKSFMFKNERKN